MYDKYTYQLYSKEEDEVIKDDDYYDLWLDEISPDGTEIRLFQLLADEDDDDDWEEDTIQNEKQKRLKDAKESTNNYIAQKEEDDVVTIKFKMF